MRHDTNWLRRVHDRSLGERLGVRAAGLVIAVLVVNGLSGSSIASGSPSVVGTPCTPSS